MSSGQFTVGDIFLSSEIPDQPFYSVFEDDGEIGYFYICDGRNEENPIIDALHIYNVENVTDKNKSSLFEIMWTEDGPKTGLFINGTCHAIFDFSKMEGRCRNNFPDSEYRQPWDDNLC